MPRVISGGVGGLLLKAPEGKLTRPTADRTKEAMFSAISARLSFEGLRVLDLFSGSGQLGIEALSRGAKHCVFVEQNAKSLSIIKENLLHCKLLEQADLRRGEVLRQVQILAKTGQMFDLILMDPPYADAWRYLVSVDKILQNASLLDEKGLLVFESESKASEQGDVRHLILEKSCKYGTAMVSFYRNPRLTQ